MRNIELQYLQYSLTNNLCEMTSLPKGNQFADKRLKLSGTFGQIGEEYL